MAWMKTREFTIGSEGRRIGGHLRRGTENFPFIGYHLTKEPDSNMTNIAF